MKIGVWIKAGPQPLFLAEPGVKNGWPIRIISAVSNWFRRRTSHELNSLNSIRLMWSTASEPGLRMRNAKQGNDLNILLKSFCTSAKNKDGTLSVYKSSSTKSIWEPPLIISFARWCSTNRFPLSLTPLLLSQIEHKSIWKRLQKTGNIAGLLEPIWNGKKPISKEQMQIDSGWLGRPESKSPAKLQRKT